MKKEGLRKAICNQLKEVDTGTLRMIHAMLKEYSAPVENDDELFEQMERISEAHKSGASPGYAAEEAIEYVRRNRKKSREIIPLTKANEAELEKRIKEYKAGKGKSYSVDEAKIELRRRISKK